MLLSIIQLRCLNILQQFDITGAEWIIGIGLVFGLAFVFTVLTEQDTRIFLIFVTVFTTFGVWAELLEVWTLIISIIAVTGIVYIELSKKRVG